MGVCSLEGEDFFELESRPYFRFLICVVISTRSPIFIDDFTNAVWKSRVTPPFRLNSFLSKLDLLNVLRVLDWDLITFVSLVSVIP